MDGAVLVDVQCLGVGVAAGESALTICRQRQGPQREDRQRGDRAVTHQATASAAAEQHHADSGDNQGKAAGDEGMAGIGEGEDPFACGQIRVEPVQYGVPSKAHQLGDGADGCDDPSRSRQLDHDGCLLR